MITALYILAGALSYLIAGAVVALIMTKLDWFDCAINKENYDRRDAIESAKVGRTMTAICWPLCLAMFLVVIIVGWFFSRVCDFVNFVINTYGPASESSEDRP